MVNQMSLPAIRAPGRSRKPRIMPGLAALTLWGGIASIFASQHAVAAWSHGHDVSLWTVAKHQLLGIGPWVILTPMVFWIAGRIPVRPPHRTRNLLLHVGVAAACLVVQVLIACSAAYVIAPELLTEPLPQHYWIYLGESFSYSIILYLVIVFFFYITQYDAKLRERDLERAELRERLAKAQLEALQLQLQPHFLFNTLNTISALIHEKPEDADLMIDQLSEFLRTVLENARGEQITLSEELRLLSVYLSIQQTRFRSRLRFEIVASEDVSTCLVPGLVLQPLVENAVKHGLAARGHGTVRITAQPMEGRLVIQVADDGAAGTTSDMSGTGVGLANTRARLQHFYGDAADITLLRKPSGGTVVTIRIPILRSLRPPRVVITKEQKRSTA